MSAARPARSVPFGTGPITFSAFLSPRNTPAGGWTWRVGPVLQIPAASNAALGSNVWGAGPSAVVVRMQGPWVYGGLFNNVFSFGGTSGRSGTRYSTFLLQPFMHYNFAEGWSVGTVPMITANWLAGGEKWTLPLGGHIARVVKLGGLAGDSVTAETTTLVVGADELDSATPSSKLKKARKLRETGDKPAIVGEAAFWQKLEVE